MGKVNCVPPKLIFRVSLILVLIVQVHSQQQQTLVDAQTQYDEDPLNPQEIEAILRNLFCVNDGEYKLQAQALKYQLLNILRNSLNYQSLEEDYDGSVPDKRSYQSLLREGAPIGGKRSVAALARSGLLRSSTNDLLDDDYSKRSIATLAKNGQLPSREPDAEIVSSTSWSDNNNNKRNLASLARSSYLSGKRTISSLARQYQLPYAYSGKRSIVSLMRNKMLPSMAPKRNVASLAKAGGYGKRNIGTLARDWTLPKVSNKLIADKREFLFDKDDEKRNIQALKNSLGHGRKKRDLQEGDFIDGSLELVEPVAQTVPLDYEELFNYMNSYYTENRAPMEKRFLGRILLPTRPVTTSSTAGSKLRFW